MAGQALAARDTPIGVRQNLAYPLSAHS
jgi:hypothetical protein